MRPSEWLAYAATVGVLLVGGPVVIISGLPLSEAVAASVGVGLLALTVGLACLYLLPRQGVPN